MSPSRAAGPSPAALLAALGTTLLAVAAITLVAARWERLGAGGRFAVLLGCSAVAVGATVALRRAAPATARALDVLLAILVPVDVAALAIVGGASWPAVLLVAGPAAALSAEVLRARDGQAPGIAAIGTIAGGLLTAVGVAAAYDLDLPPLVAALGLAACWVSPWDRARAAGPVWAALAGLAPALWVLDDVVFTGEGTLRRIGLIDPRHWEPTLLAGALAALALARTAERRRSLSAGTTAVAVAVATAGAMWSVHQPPRSLLVVAGAVLVALAELALTDRRVLDGAASAFLPFASSRRAIETSVDRAVAALGAALGAAVAAVAVSTVLPDPTNPGVEWAYAAAVGVFAWIVRDVRRSRAEHLVWRDVVVVGPRSSIPLWGATVGATTAVLLAAGPAASAVVAVATACVVRGSARRARLPVAWTAAIGASLLAVGSPMWLLVATAGIGTVLVSLIALEVGRRSLVDARQAFAGVLIAVAALAGGVAAWSPAVGLLAAAGGLLLSAAIVESTDPPSAVVARGLALAIAVSAGADDHTLAAAALLGGALLMVTHLAVRNRSSSLVLALGMGAGAALLATERWSDPVVVVALFVAAVGVALFAAGVDRAVVVERGVGDALAGIGVFVVWFGSLLALAGAEVASVEPYLYPVLAGVAVASHRSEGAAERSGPRAPSWVTLLVAAMPAGAIAFLARLEGRSVAHMLVFGSTGVLVALVGARWRQRRTVAVGTAASVSVAGYEALASTVGVESWGWLMISGTVALVVAALLEIFEEEGGPAVPSGG